MRITIRKHPKKIETAAQARVAVTEAEVRMNSTTIGSRGWYRAVKRYQDASLALSVLTLAERGLSLPTS
jgi:hypothetical protein